jgi:hypothetical protein
VKSTDRPEGETARVTRLRVSQLWRVVPAAWVAVARVPASSQLQDAGGGGVRAAGEPAQWVVTVVGGARGVGAVSMLPRSS